MYTYFQQALPIALTLRTQVVKRKWKFGVLFNPTKENRVNQTKISTKTDRDGFSRAVFRSRLDEKTPVIERLVCYACVLFSMAMSMLRMDSCVSFNFLLT